jgi:hypothetical protein
MRYLLVSAAAVMAITGAAAIGNAQMDDKGKGPGGGSAPGSSMQGAPGGERAQQPGRSEQKSEPSRGPERQGQQGQMERRGAEQTPKAGQDQGRDRSKSATQPQQGDQQKATERQRDQDRKAADQRKGDQDRKAADQRKGDQDRKAADERKGDQDRKAADQRKGDQDRKAADQRKGDQDRQRADRDRDQQKTTADRDRDGQQGRVQVSEEKRSGVRERLVKERNVERISRSRINVSINVGARIPRSVRLHTLPVQIVSFAPAYRGYSYILLEDETICIVDPRTYVIVDVIPAGSQRAERPGRTHLTLSQEDMRFIYRTVPKDRTANVRVRLALGAEVPREVELLDFPPEVVERVPDVRRYRYVVTDRDVVIVDPNDHEVALVIND